MGVNEGNPQQVIDVKVITEKLPISITLRYILLTSSDYDIVICSL